MPELADDYLAAEGFLKAHLEGLEGIKKVYRTCDLQELKESLQVTPALHIIYAGDHIEHQSNGGYTAKVAQTWLVVLAINLRDADKAGAHLARVIKHMSGCVCELGNFVRVSASNRPGFGQGFGYYPLAYQIKFTTKGVTR
jgi:hypothetical protein